MRARNLRACVTARLVSSAPLMPRRKAEVVLDPARRAGLAAERGALDQERVEALGGAVDRGAQAGRAAADDEQVDRFARRELQTDAKRARDVAVGGIAELESTGQPHER